MSARWLWVGVVFLLVVVGLWVAHVYGWLPLSLQIATLGSESSKVTGASTSSVANSTVSSSGADGSSVNSTSVVVGVVSSVRDLLASLFEWLLGDSIGSAIINMAVLLVLLAVVYAVMKFVKYIALIVVSVGALLIILKYVLGVVV